MDLGVLFDPIGDMIGTFGEFLYSGGLVLALAGLLAAPKAWLFPPASRGLVLVARYAVGHETVGVVLIVLAILSDPTWAREPFALVAGGWALLGAVLWGAVLFAPGRASERLNLRG